MTLQYTRIKDVILSHADYSHMVFNNFYGVLRGISVH